MKLLNRPAASAAGAGRAALIELTRVVDVLQAGSLDGLDDHEVLAVFQDLEAQRRRLPTVDHRLITELECRAAASFPTMRPVHRTHGLPGHPLPGTKCAPLSPCDRLGAVHTDSHLAKCVTALTGQYSSAGCRTDCTRTTSSDTAASAARQHSNAG